MIPVVEKLHGLQAFPKLQRQKFHPYHVSLPQELRINDFGNHVTFCQKYDGEYKEIEIFFLLLTDKSTIIDNLIEKNIGILCRMFATTNQRVMLFILFCHV